LYDWRGSWGAFDWLISARGGVSDREGPSQSALGGEESNTQYFSFGLDRPLTTGGLFGASFDTENTETNSTVQLINPSTRDVFSLSYTQPLLRGAWSRYATSQQRELEQLYQGQLESQRRVRQALIRSVSDAYWDLVSSREQLEVARSSLELAREQVSQNQRRLDAGVGTDVEVLQAEAEVATREERRLFADVRARQASDRLKQLIFPGTDEVLWEAALVPLTPLPAEVDASATPTWTAALAVALEMRPELRQQRRQIESAEERHLRRRNERWPALDLELIASSEGFSGESSDAFEDAAAYEFPTYTASLIFSVPIENRTARNAAKAAWAELRAARLVYDQIETQIAGEVREAVRQVIYQALAVQAARKSLQLAERQLAAEQARYAEDLSTTFQVLEFQQDLALAMSSERAARANFARALVALESAMGRIGEAPASTAEGEGAAPQGEAAQEPEGAPR
jgi:outer membrane protein TolC